MQVRVSISQLKFVSAVKFVVRCSQDRGEGGSVVRCSKPCKKAGMKGETSNELTAGLISIESAFDLNVPSNRPPLRTNVTLIERTHFNRGNTVYSHSDAPIGIAMAYIKFSCLFY